MFSKSRLAPLPQPTPPSVSSQKANKLPTDTASVQSWPLVSQHPEMFLKPKQTAGQLQPTMRPAAHVADNQSVHVKMAALLQQQGSADKNVQPRQSLQLRSQPSDDHSKAAFALPNPNDDTTAAVRPDCGLPMDNRMEPDAVPSAAAAAPMDALQARSQDGSLDLQNVTAKLAGIVNSNVLPEDSSRECNTPSVTPEAVRAELIVDQSPSAAEFGHVVANQTARVKSRIHQPQEASGRHVGKDGYTEAAQHHTTEDLVARVADFDRDTAAADTNMSALHHVEMSSAGLASLVASPNTPVLQNPADISPLQESHLLALSGTLIQSSRAQLQASSKRRMPFSWYKYGRTWRRLITL
ncbi:TPA: hypothetical protein ACH3X1_013275 [Trebouxia sp. C0004]